MSDLRHFAMLAPVPLEHLQWGLEVSAETGLVAYGTQKWELFRQLNEMRGDGRVAVLMYPSHESLPGKDSFVVGWFGWYAGSEESRTGKHSKGMAHRPPTTVVDGAWAAFWHVTGLRELPPEKRLPIGKIQGHAGGWRKDAPPRGPELVTLPESLSYET